MLQGATKLGISRHRARSTSRTGRDQPIVLSRWSASHARSLLNDPADWRLPRRQRYSSHRSGSTYLVLREKLCSASRSVDLRATRRSSVDTAVDRDAVARTPMRSARLESSCSRSMPLAAKRVGVMSPCSTGRTRMALPREPACRPACHALDQL